MSSPLRGIVLSTFNCDNLVRLLNQNEVAGVGCEVESAPYGNVLQVAFDDRAECWKSSLDFAVIWARPQEVIPSFQSVLNEDGVSPSAWEEEVATFFSGLDALRGRSRWLFLASFYLGVPERFRGILSMRPGTGPQSRVWDLNARLMQFAAKFPNVFVLDTASWFDSTGAATDFRSYYLSKSPYTLPVYVNAKEDISAALVGLRGRTKKLIALDLDDTLWGGIVGDEGWENLRLGGHDAVGESFADFQRALKRLKSRGILLGIVSKNDEAIALRAIENHPGMQLRKGDFAGWRINWDDKASNLVSLAEELNIGLDSIVFVDDNPAERARVREELPEVTVPEWPANRMSFLSSFAALPLFDLPRVTEEDRRRTLSYRAEAQRKLLHKEVASVDEWLKSLQIVVEIELLSSRNLQRAEQLFNKTNQFNLSTRRLSRVELESWGQAENRKVWCFSVRDRFGDSGLVGLAGIEWGGGECRVTDLILSCRVFGRKVERVMLATVLDFAGQSGKGVTARYRATPKNHPTLKFLKESGLNEIESNAVFTWPKGSSYRFPEGIKVVRA